MNLQVGHQPKTEKRPFRTDYLMKVFRYDRTLQRFDEVPLENQIDRDRILADASLKSDLVTWDRVEATGVDAATRPFSVKVARILAKGAYGRVVLEPDYEINIRAVLEQQPPPPGAVALDLKPVAAPKRAPARRAAEIDLPVDIGRIDFVDGRMDFTDLTVQPHFSANIQGLNGAVTGLSARAGSRAKVDLKGAGYEYEPDEETILATLLPRNVTVQVLAAMLENQAGFFAAQMTAMDNATRNAGDMINSLNIVKNRTRQAQITKELIEIISGAEAL